MNEQDRTVPHRTLHRDRHTHLPPDQATTNHYGRCIQFRFPGFVGASHRRELLAWHFASTSGLDWTLVPQPSNTRAQVFHAHAAHAAYAALPAFGSCAASAIRSLIHSETPASSSQVESCRTSILDLECRLDPPCTPATPATLPRPYPSSLPHPASFCAWAQASARSRWVCHPPLSLPRRLQPCPYTPHPPPPCRRTGPSRSANPPRWRGATDR
jgi:hypothetical protein